MKVHTLDGTFIVTWEYVQIRNTGRYHTFCHIRRQGSVTDLTDTPGWAIQHKDDTQHVKEVGRRVSLTDALKVAEIDRPTRKLFWSAYWNRGV